MNIQYHFLVLVFLIVLERSHLDCYTTLRFVHERFFHILPSRGRLDYVLPPIYGSCSIHDFFVTGIGHIQCYVFLLNFCLEHLRISFFTVKGTLITIVKFETRMCICWNLR